jgi:hypothetical protein
VRVAVAGWQWQGRMRRVIAVILSGGKLKNRVNGDAVSEDCGFRLPAFGCGSGCGCWLWLWLLAVAVVVRVAVAGWQWHGRMRRVIAVILSGGKLKNRAFFIGVFI